MKRTTAGQLGREAVEIMERGAYLAPSGRDVSIALPLADAKARTRDFPPDLGGLTRGEARHETVFEVTGETTIGAARRLAAERPLALNFASAKNPGGGFLGGAIAQEECLARSSGLYACIASSRMYAHHRALGDPMYTSWVVYSPDVPVFREDEGALLEEPYLASFLTCPAVNAGVVRERRAEAEAAIARAMDERVNRVLAVAAHARHTTLVLGAWGCGVFRNDADTVARLFEEALRGDHRGVFARVVFAILDRSPDGRFIGPFRRRFAPARAGG